MLLPLNLQRGMVLILTEIHPQKNHLNIFKFPPLKNLRTH
uniref:Uncharacterized protein n=1 Tax=Anguilla anguilla TaxID=7936 RepID=A0A0E9SWN3_ANGAN